MERTIQASILGIFLFVLSTYAFAQKGTEAYLVTTDRKETQITILKGNNGEGIYTIYLGTEVYTDCDYIADIYVTNYVKAAGKATTGAIGGAGLGSGLGIGLLGTGPIGWGVFGVLTLVGALAGGAQADINTSVMRTYCY